MKRTITWATLQRRIEDGIVRQTGTLHTKGKTYAQLVDREGRPLTVQVTGVLLEDRS